MDSEKRWSELTLDEKIISLKKEKMTHRRVAQRLGCSTSKVVTVLKKNKMTSGLFHQIGDIEPDGQEEKEG